MKSPVARSAPPPLSLWQRAADRLVPSPGRDIHALIVAGVGLSLLAGVQGCMLVMDTDFDKYHEQTQQVEPSTDAGLPPSEAGADSTTDAAQSDAADEPDVVVPRDARDDQQASGTCFDHVKNQNETGVDCGGVCKPCPSVGFAHHENFNQAPSGWSPDGEYEAAGACNDALTVDGWVIADEVPAEFTKASGRFATISTAGSLVVGCDDVMVSPALQTNGASTIDIYFDSNFKVDLDSTASVWLVRDQQDGVKIWDRTKTSLNEHVKIGSIPVGGAKTVRIVFRYKAYLEYYWDVDNVSVIGK